MFMLRIRLETFWTHPGEIGAQLIGEICVAAVAGPQIGGFGLRRDWGNIHNGNSPGFRQPLTQLIRDLHKALLLVGSGTVCRAFEACIDKLDVEHCNLRLRRSGAGDSDHPNQQSGCDFPRRTHDRISRLTRFDNSQYGRCRLPNKLRPSRR
jgi:hypothetical protein